MPRASPPGLLAGVDGTVRLRGAQTRARGATVCARKSAGRLGRCRRRRCRRANCGCRPARRWTGQHSCRLQLADGTLALTTSSPRLLWVRTMPRPRSAAASRRWSGWPATTSSSSRLSRRCSRCQRDRCRRALRVDRPARRPSARAGRTVLCRDPRHALAGLRWAKSRGAPADARLTAATAADAASSRAASTADGRSDPRGLLRSTAWHRSATARMTIRSPASIRCRRSPTLRMLMRPGPLPSAAVEAAGRIADPSLAGADFAPCATVPPCAPVPGPGSSPNAASIRSDPSFAGDIIELQAPLAALSPRRLATVVAARRTAAADAARDTRLAQHLRHELRRRLPPLAAASCATTTARNTRSWCRRPRPPPGSSPRGSVSRHRPGPANEIARATVTVDRRVRRRDPRHPASGGINVFLHERDGLRLSAARTLSLDPLWRQLSVRRLMLMLRRALASGCSGACSSRTRPPCAASCGG